MKRILKTMLLLSVIVCLPIHSQPASAQNDTITIEVDDYESLEELYRRYDVLRNDPAVRTLQEALDAASPWLPRNTEFQGNLPVEYPWKVDGGTAELGTPTPLPDSGNLDLPENIFDTLILEQGIPPEDLKRALEELDRLGEADPSGLDPQSLLNSLPSTTRQYFEGIPEQQLIPLLSGVRQEMPGLVQYYTQPSPGRAGVGSLDSLADELLQGLGEIALTRAERQGFMLVKQTLITLLSQFRFNGPVFSHTIEYLETNTLVAAFNTHQLLKIQLIRDVSRFISDVITYSIFNYPLLQVPSVKQGVEDVSQAIASYLELYLLSDITPEKVFSRSDSEVFMEELYAGFAKIQSILRSGSEDLDDEFTFMLSLIVDQLYILLNEEDYLGLAVQEVAGEGGETTVFVQTYRAAMARFRNGLTTLGAVRPVLKTKLDQIRSDLRSVIIPGTETVIPEEDILRLLFDISSLIPMIHDIQRDVSLEDSITRLSIRSRRYLANYPQFLRFFEHTLSYVKNGNFSLAVYTMTDFILNNIDSVTALFTSLEEGISTIPENAVAIKKGSALLSTISIYLETYDPENEKYRDKASGELAEIRQASLDTLIQAVTDRTARTGEYILSLGGNVGVFTGLQNVATKTLETAAWSAGAWLPVGLALQWMPEVTPGVGFHSMLYFFDLGQYIFVEETALSLNQVTWRNAFTIGGQLGMVIAPWGPSVLISVGPYVQYTPLISDGQGNAFYHFGLGLGLYIPFFDVN
ncbi:hypothetical protein [Spirochaeta lutea]|uniref:Uncharacterized protein n=1 Tax=Spirochaeta lutea TaxID=1480694 RepID=A0A098QTS1_9SPIO|nr:hypothetical protein [Spirochaeta lutea]KGE70966.1 hypothetical protein DC28_13590 [Spirochaeta lutea]